MSILINSSYGELFDKLSILELKIKFITDEQKLIEIKKEYNTLLKSLNINITDNFYYKILKQINEQIWLDQNKVRELMTDNNSKEKLLDLCIKIMTDYNDRRFRVKSKINNLFNSGIKEQKGYDKKIAFHIGDMGLGDHIHQIGAVRYLSTLYDKVIVSCKKNNEKNIKDIYSNDDNIVLYVIESEKDLVPRYGCEYNKFKTITNNTTVYMTGCNLPNGGGGPYNYIAVKPYEYLNLNFSIFWEYFNISNKTESINLFENVKHLKYIFVHDMAAHSVNGIVFTLENVTDELLINPCRNMYNKNHKYFNLAEKFINKPILDYVDTIKNANMLILSDSAFFALAINLEIKTDKCYYTSRWHYYHHIWSDKYIYNSKKVNRRKFKFLHKPQFQNILIDIKKYANI
jgi:hypothetical protein